MKSAVFEFLSRNVKMLYRQSERSLSGRVGWLDLRENFSLYYIVIFYKIKYIFFRIQKPRARPHARDPDSLLTKTPRFHLFTFSPFHLFTISALTKTPRFHLFTFSPFHLFTFSRFRILRKHHDFTFSLFHLFTFSRFRH